MLSKIRHYVPPIQLVSLYHSIFHCHLRYGSQIWGQQNNNVLHKIEVIQNSVIRIIHFAELRASANPLYRESKILKIHDEIKLQNFLLIHDFMNSNLPTCFDDRFDTLASQYDGAITRRTLLGCLYQPSVNSTKYGLLSIKQRSIHLWNSLCGYYKTNLSTINRSKLKKMLHKYFIDQY